MLFLNEEGGELTVNPFATYPLVISFTEIKPSSEAEA